MDDLKSPKRRSIIIEESFNLTTADGWVFSCFKPSRNSNLYFIILAGNTSEIRASGAHDASGSQAN